ncbi:MAG TPA: 50S ribosomal protein L32 [Candidatus Omnitrophota bacterium]|mgnify:CR=1 FL=1|nr:50S ribosomal protein L32 [Candidatus Omnitrophota bacterium]
MPNPKRQHSRQRQRKRRTHYKVTLPSFAQCPQCRKPILSHRVCPFCGYYKNQPVLDMTPEETAEKN